MVLVVDIKLASAGFLRLRAAFHSRASVGTRAGLDRAHGKLTQASARVLPRAGIAPLFVIAVISG